MNKIVKWLVAIVVCVVCIGYTLPRVDFEHREEVDGLNNKHNIAYIESVKDGKIYINAMEVHDKQEKELYFEHESFKKGMFADDSSIQSYFLLKSTDESQNNFLYDYMNSNVYELESSRCKIIAETVNYIYIEMFCDDDVSIVAFSKENEKIMSLGVVFQFSEEYFESVATSNYDSDKVYWCYALNGKTYVCIIEGETISTEKISDKSLSSVVCMDSDGERYFAMYDTKSIPYKYVPTIIQKKEDGYMENSIEQPHGGILFSVVCGGNYYMGYSNGDLLEIYTANTDGFLEKISEYPNAQKIAYKISEKGFCVRADETIFNLF